MSETPECSTFSTSDRVIASASVIADENYHQSSIKDENQSSTNNNNENQQPIIATNAKTDDSSVIEDNNNDSSSSGIVVEVLENDEPKTNTTATCNEKVEDIILSTNNNTNTNTNTLTTNITNTMSSSSLQSSSSPLPLLQKQTTHTHGTSALDLLSKALTPHHHHHHHHHQHHHQDSSSTLENNTTKHPTTANTTNPNPNNDDIESQSLSSTSSSPEHDCLHSRTGIRISEIVTTVGWLVCIGVYLFYLYSSIVGYLDAQANPSTSVSYVESVPLNYPAVTICNWNAAYYCDYCNLTLKQCTMVNDTDGTLFNCPFTLTETVIEQNGQIFNCLVFNNDTSKPMAVRTTGYGGSISMYFTLPLVPPDRDARFGLQASFHEIGSIPPVFAETNFAIPFVDNFYILTKVETSRLPRSRSGNSDGSLNSIRWDSRISNVQLTVKEDSIVVLSFAYSTLNVHKVSEIAGKTLLQLFGDLAGMLGVLLGIDILKALRGCLEVPQAVQQKSFRPIYDLFN